MTGGEVIGVAVTGAEVPAADVTGAAVTGTNVTVVVFAGCTLGATSAEGRRIKAGSKTAVVISAAHPMIITLGWIERSMFQNPVPDILYEPQPHVPDSRFSLQMMFYFWSDAQDSGLRQCLKSLPPAAVP